MLPILPSLATALAILVLAVMGGNVARARGRYKIQAPATAGPPEFERIYRAHQNMTEQIVVFLPALWLFSVFVSPFWAGLIGLFWVLARIYYAWSYYGDANRRSVGFALGLIAALVLLIGGLVGIIAAAL
jgi:glutathione S-transferase